ncbi:sodium-dependent phosphate transport protein 2B-like [Takifugu rubripes]|nr:sodium-dependent phosphate transport protein 2B-like [Takifugu rubripes]
MASPGDRRANALQISLVHFLFNISGIPLWYPVPCTRIPIRLAKGLGNVTASHRWFAVVYIVLCFFLLPLVVFSLSLAGRSVLVGVGAPLLTMLLIILLINILQKRKPVFLPPGLRSWSFLPLWARSLDPWDRVVEVFTAMCCCWCKCCHLAAAVEQERPEQRAAEREQQERQQRGGHEPCDVGRDAGGK